MASEDQIPKMKARRSKRNFSVEDKKRYYSLWKTSGLTMQRFCKEQDLVSSAFAKWCRMLSSLEKTSESSQNNWTPVIAKENVLENGSHLMALEIKIPNSIKIYICLFLLILFFRESISAINALW